MAIETKTVQARKRQLVWTSAAGLGLLAVIVVLLNALASVFFLRLDLTGHHAYSLSPASKRLVRTLDDPVIVKAFFTPDLPAPYNAYQRYVRDLLTEYRAASRGKVRFEFVLPHPAQDFERKAAEANLNPLQFEEVGSDQLQIRRGYMGLVLYHRDRSEVLPVIKDVQQLEYDITSRIAKMANRAKKVIAVTSGHGEHRWQTPQSNLANDLSELNELKDWALPPSTTAPFAADAILVAGPRQKVDEKSLWAIDQALMRGIPVAFLVDIKNLMVGQFMVTSQDAGLGDLLQRYGVQVGDRLVYDAQCETISVTQNIGGLSFTTSLRYPFIPLVTQMARSHPLTRGLETVGLPFATTIEPVTKLPPGVRFTPLFISSPRSWLATASPYASVSPTNIPNPGRDEPHGPYTLGGLLEGSFTSFFQGKASPVPEQNLIGTSPRTSLFVLGTGRVLDPNLPQFLGSEALVSNILAYLSKDDVLIGIRSKGEIIRPLKPVPRAVREVVKYGVVIGVALLPVALGLWRWRSRERWRRTIGAAFAEKTPSPLVGEGRGEGGRDNA
jgi:gliding-associated putative ABC transporter substrate-binding component GldG